MSDPHTHFRSQNHRATLRTICVCALFMSGACSGIAQEKSSALDLIRPAKNGSPELARSVTQTFSAAELRAGTVAKGHLSSFFFAIDSASKPTLSIRWNAGA